LLAWLAALSPVGLQTELPSFLSWREELRDTELARLEAVAAGLRRQLEVVEQAKLAEELACIRDITTLRRWVQRER
jgi:hypothetical protein